MKTNPSTNTCPKCGVAVPPEAPQGLCPKCVLARAALATEAGLPPTATAEIPSIERIAAAFPQLEIIELIGRGGMGFVFKARQPHLDRFVALKLLPDKLALDPQFTERFTREARTLARLSHPNIVSVFDFGQVGGFCYLMMEYVDGVNLRQAMRAGRFSPSAALGIVPKVCEALQFAHERGVLHRDIKPENILLDQRGGVKIADFGIAKLIGEGHTEISLTGTGATLGTPHYMAPEQLEKPNEVDHRADIYSLGVVFYEMLTGELPIGRFAPPSEKTPVNHHVDEVVFRTLEKEREKRYQSAGEVKTEVEHLTAAGSVLPPVMGIPQSRPVLREMNCHISTPEHVRSFVGRYLYVYQGHGRLQLLPETLVFTRGWSSVTIPLAQIKALGIGHYAATAKPTRLDFLAITFLDHGTTRELFFTPQESNLSPAWDTNQHVADWFAAVRDGVKRLTGVTPPQPPAELLGAKMPSMATQFFAMMFIVAVPMLMSLAMLWIVTGRFPTKLAELLAMVVAMVAGAVALMFKIWRSRRALMPAGAAVPRGPHGTMAVRQPAPRWLKPVTILYLVFGVLGLIAMIIRLGSGQLAVGSFLLLGLTGLALLKRTSALRKVAIGANIVGLFMPWFSVLHLTAGMQEGTFAISLNPMIGGNSLGLSILFALLETAAVLSGLLVLNRPDVKALFDATPHAGKLSKSLPADASPALSRPAIWGAILSGLALVLVGGPLMLMILGGGGIGSGELLLLILPGCLCGIVGTVLGWVALSQIRAAQGRLTGVPLALFAALACPALALVGITVAVPAFTLVSSDGSSGPGLMTRMLAMLIPAGVLTLVIWAIFSTARWASNQPAVEKRGVLKWIFLVLLLVGLGSTLFNPGSRSVQRGASERPQPQMHHQTVAEADERVVDTTLSNSISFTITAVDLRLEKGQRWLAIQYVDDVRGDCERVFRTESHGFKFTARTTASIANPPGSPPVRAQRVEWLVPEGVSETEAEAFRDAVAKSIREKSFVVAQGAERRLFNLPVGSVGNLSVVIGAIPKLASP